VAGSEACSACPAGTYAAKPAMVHCSKCGVGKGLEDAAIANSGQPFDHQLVKDKQPKMPLTAQNQTDQPSCIARVGTSYCL
jgi:hypothetical protein